MTADQPTVGRDGLAVSFISPSPEWMNRWASSGKGRCRTVNARGSQHQLLQGNLHQSPNRIAFVSADTSIGGDVKPTNSLVSLNKVISEVHPSGYRVPRNVNTTDSKDTSRTIDQASPSQMSRITRDEARNPLPLPTDSFYIDLRGSEDHVKTGLPMPVVRRSPSPTGSVSSEEEIIFRGRGESHHGSDKPVIWSWQGDTPRAVASPAPNLKGRDSQQAGEPIRVSTPTSLPTLHVSDLDEPSSRNDPRSKFRNTKVLSRAEKKNRLQRRGKKEPKSTKDDLMADYIANIGVDDDITRLTDDSMLWTRQLDTMGTDVRRGEFEDSTDLTEAADGISDSISWSTSDLEAFEDLSTSNEVLAEVDEIISKRERPSGLQYLVVPTGFTIDDARWYPVELLGRPTAQQRIRIYESEKARRETFMAIGDSDSSLNSNEQLDRDLQDDLHDLADKQDLLDRHRDRMTDEHLARLLSKQEELGLGSDDLLLYDGVEYDLSLDGIISRSQGDLKSGSIRRKAKHRSRSQIPSAAIMADRLGQDPYDGFDVMDQDRPSLRRKVMGRHDRNALELSDSELEHSLQSQWENDRSKKKLRKEARENLRAQGLLGKKGKANSKNQQSGGISLAQVKDQIEEFLGSTNENLILPPMSDRDRKLVHEIANTFKLTSKSSGKGDNRFPVLYRTKRTLAFDEGLLSRKQLRLFLGKAVLPRQRIKKQHAGVARGAGFSKTAVSYHDGDIVGAAAPELGLENKGRTMLERMGWSTGTALGAFNNPGIMQPVTHIVKNSKAGLG